MTRTPFPDFGIAAAIEQAHNRGERPKKYVIVSMKMITDQNKSGTRSCSPKPTPCLATTSLLPIALRLGRKRIAHTSAGIPQGGKERRLLPLRQSLRIALKSFDACWRHSFQRSLRDSSITDVAVRCSLISLKIFATSPLLPSLFAFSRRHCRHGTEKAGWSLHFSSSSTSKLTTCGSTRGSGGSWSTNPQGRTSSSSPISLL